MCDLSLSKGESRLQPCNPSANLHARLRSCGLKSGPSYFDIRQSPEYRQCQVRAIATSTTQAESLRAPPHQQNSRSCGRSSKGSRVQQEHLRPRSEDPTYRALASEFPQGSHLQASENIASSLNGLQGLCISPLQKPIWNPGSCKPYQNDKREDRLSARGPGQGNAAFRSRAMNYTDVEPDGRNPPGTPQMKTIPLPWKQEADQHLIYDEPALGGGWLSGSSKSGPKPLSRLDLDANLPVPFTWCADAR